MSAREPGPAADVLLFEGPRRSLPDPSLKEIWSMVAARRRLVMIVAAIACLASAAAAFLYEPDYVYTSSTEIGIASNDGRLIESPDTIVAKLQENYIPETQRASEFQALGPVTVRVPRGSQLVVIESRGNADDAPRHEALHSAIVDRLRQDHLRALVARRNALERERADAERRLEESADRAALHAAGLERLDTTERVLARQRATLQAAVAAARKTRTQAMDNPAGDGEVPSILLLDHEILSAEERLASLEERLAVTIEAERAAETKASADARREQDAARRAIVAAQTELDNLRETRAVGPARRSNEPIGPGRLALAALGSVGGVLAGVLIAVAIGLVRRGSFEHGGISRS